MPSTFAKSHIIKIQAQFKEYEVNMRYMHNEIKEELHKTLMAGAAAYATSAQRHTPPGLGKQDIPEVYYQTIEADFVLPKGWRTQGRRVIYPLREVLHNPRTTRLKSMFGKLLRHGYEYVVVIHSHEQQRHGRWTYYKPCTTYDEAKRYATEDYRGLMRAAWGMGFIAETGKMPPVFNKYLRRRPMLDGLKNLSRVSFFPEQDMVELENSVIDEGEGFLTTTKLAGHLAALRTMNDRMEKFFKKKKFEI